MKMQYFPPWKYKKKKKKNWIQEKTWGRLSLTVYINQFFS